MGRISDALKAKIKETARNKICNATAQCPKSPNGKHQYVGHTDEHYGKTHHTHYCKWCGKIH